MLDAADDILVNVSGEVEPCRVYVGPDVSAPISERALVVVDARVARQHPDRVPAGPCLEIAGGEGAKTLASVEVLWRFFADHEADRRTMVVGVGGGTVTDLVGFAASTWLRGMPFGFVATTLLAQVDAALGGKNGINFLGFKNQVGLVRQPSFVTCDPAFLLSLSARDYVAGLAEVVKYALIGSPGLLELLEDSVDALRDRDGGVLARVVRASVAAKVAVVQADPYERGYRRVLNLGHTVGHAYEAVLGVNHGEAVAAGLIDACELSVRRGLLDPAVTVRLRRLLEALGLPGRLDAPSSALSAALRRDKKREVGQVFFVFLRGVGQPVVESVPLDFLDAYLDGSAGGGA